MDWMHNPIGNMYGPQFLKFYAMIIISVFVISKVIFYFYDPSPSSEPPSIPSPVDPYEVAYLIGGENEVLRLSILDLIQRGYLERLAKTRGDEIVQAKGHPDERHLNTLEEAVFGFFITPYAPQDIFQSSLPERLKVYCDHYRRKLDQKKFLFNETEIGFLKGIITIGLIVIIGLGAYKLVVALAKGRYNVEFLILMTLGAAFLYLRFCSPTRISVRGQKYLQRLELAFERLDNRELKLSFYVTDPSLLLMAGIFGVGALTGTVYNYFPNLFQKATNRWYSSGSCGAGCGYAGSSSGSSASCGGGGGCGGGGCGGCGG